MAATIPIKELKGATWCPAITAIVKLKGKPFLKGDVQILYPLDIYNKPSLTICNDKNGHSGVGWLYGRRLGHRMRTHPRETSSSPPIDLGGPITDNGHCQWPLKWAAHTSDPCCCCLLLKKNPFSTLSIVHCSPLGLGWIFVESRGIFEDSIMHFEGLLFIYRKLGQLCQVLKKVMPGSISNSRELTNIC